MKKHSRLVLSLLLFFVSASAQSQSTLDDRVKSLVSSFNGRVSLLAKNLDTGQTYSLNPDEPVRTASTRAAASKETIDLMKREQGRNAIGPGLWNVPMACVCPHVATFGSAR